jgi:hypothetical protein
MKAGEIGGSKVNIPGRHCRCRVPHQALQRQRVPAPEQPGNGEGVAERVRTDALAGDAGLCAIFPDALADAVAQERLSEGTDEKQLLRCGLGAAGEVLLEQPGDRLTLEDGTRLAALAHHGDSSVALIHVSQRDRQQLADAQASIGQECHQGKVARTREGAAVRLGQEARHLFGSERLDLLLGELGLWHALHRRSGEPLFSQEPVEEGVEHPVVGLQRVGLAAALLELAQERLAVGAGYLID